MRTVRTIIKSAERQADVADRVGLDPAYISQVGSGKRTLGSTRTFARFAAAYRLTGDEVVASLRDWFPEIFDDEATDAAA